MKRIFVFVVAVVATIFSASAQRYEMPKNELSVGVGYATHPHLAIGFGDVFSSIISGDYSDEKTYGSYSLQYLHNCSRHFAFGVTGAFEHIYKDSKMGNDYKENFLTIMPTIKTNWFRKKVVGMYSRLALGVSFNHFDGYEGTDAKSGNNTYFAFQVSPVCIEIGSSKVAGFFEIGYGYQGVVNAGVRFGF